MDDFTKLSPADFRKLAVGSPSESVRDALLRLVVRKLVEELTDGIAIARVSATNSPLIYVNSAFERLTGYERHEVLGKDCRYLQGNNRDQAEIARIRSALANGEAVDATLRNYRKDGSAFWNRLSLRPIGVVGILRDVSAIRQTEIDLDRTAHFRYSDGVSQSFRSDQTAQRTPTSLPTINFKSTIA